LASDAVVGAFIVVVVEPGVESSGALVIAGPGAGVGPFGLEGAVEALDFAVLPGAVGLDEELLGAELGDRVVEQGRVPVGEGVVADDFSDLDP
jgi:hypothetical protein